MTFAPTGTAERRAPFAPIDVPKEGACFAWEAL